ncbi:MAG: sugar phosphate isomerase/epimerase [Clostridia bacterium]|nr:sugar phosphate isomerase/epimerase [Clostridia bacterium]
MRLGAYIDGFSGAEDWALKHVELGYGAAFWPQDAVDCRSTDAQIEAYRQAARRHGLVIAEVGVWNNLLERNPIVQRENMEYAIGQLRLADRVGARCAVNIGGSLNADCWYGPHDNNLSERTFDQIVDLIQQVIDTAKPQNTYYTIEPQGWLIPHDIRSQAKLIERVNRSSFGVHVDMCNMVNSMEKAYATGALVRDFFREFGGLVRSVHAKDLIIENHVLSFRLREVIPGQGMFDHEALLRCCDALDADMPVLAEHLTTQEEYLQATGFLAAKAKELKLEFIRGY